MNADALSVVAHRAQISTTTRGPMASAALLPSKGSGDRTGGRCWLVEAAAMDQMRETAGITVRTIVRYARARGGDVAVARLLALSDAAELPEVYEDPRRWWSHALKIRMFQ